MAEDYQYGEANLADVKFLTLTAASFRDLAMTGMVSSGPGLIKDFLPTPKELDTVSAMVLEAVSAGKLIDFGHWPNELIKRSCERACDLYMQGALGHPFTTPWCFIHTWDDPQQDEWIGWKTHQNSSVYLVNPFPDNGSTLGCDVEIVTFEGFDMPVHKSGLRMKLLGVGDRGILLPKSHVPIGDSYACNVIPVQFRFPQAYWDHYAMAVRKPTGPEAAMKAAAANIFEPFFLALLMLNTRGLPSETIRYDKLNKSRIKNNKYAIPPYRKIDSTAYVTTMMNRFSGQRVYQGGTHASPVAHIRQGHWRNYKSGERTFINDTLVNATPEMREMFRSNRTMYKVKDDKNNG